MTIGLAHTIDAINAIKRNNMVNQIENTYCIATVRLTYMFETLVIPYKEISHITKLHKISAEIRGLEPNPSFGKANCPKAGEFLDTILKRSMKLTHLKFI